MTRAAILIVAPRQLSLAKRRASVNHPQTRLPLLIQIDAPFSPRLSRHNEQPFEQIRGLIADYDEAARDS